MNNKRQWYNYRTEEYEHIDQLPDDYRDYLPRGAFTLGLYDTLKKLGQSPSEAYSIVCQLILGDE